MRKTVSHLAEKQEGEGAEQELPGPDDHRKVPSGQLGGQGTREMSRRSDKWVSSPVNLKLTTLMSITGW